jgi:hypothetical protein
MSGREDDKGHLSDEWPLDVARGKDEGLARVHSLTTLRHPCHKEVTTASAYTVHSKVPDSFNDSRDDRAFISSSSPKNSTAYRVFQSSLLQLIKIGFAGDRLQC